MAAIDPTAVVAIVALFSVFAAYLVGFALLQATRRRPQPDTDDDTPRDESKPRGHAGDGAPTTHDFREATPL